jgi:hypothetical protein
MWSRRKYKFMYNGGKCNKVTNRTGCDDHVVDPKARERCKKDKIFDVQVDVTFPHGGGHDG